MKFWINRNYRSLIITAFVIPIVTVAVVSISHVTQWYGISNPLSWAIYLSVGVEIAAMSALAAISARMGKNVYFPFIVVTFIQFIGNIFFSYQYIDMSSAMFKSWVELVSPVVQFLGIEPTDFIGHKRFLSLFAGGLLPVISLSFLHMLVKFTQDNGDKEEVIKLKDNLPESNIKLDEEKLKDLIDDAVRVKITEDDLKKAEEILMKKTEVPPIDQRKRTLEYLNSLPTENLSNYFEEPEQDDGTYPEMDDETTINDVLEDNLPEVTDIVNYEEEVTPYPLNEEIVVKEEFIEKSVDDVKKKT